MNRFSKLSASFEKASETYNESSHLQNLVAHKLSDRILNKEQGSLGTVLEVGCRTGGLSSYLASHSDLYVLTDPSFPFLEKAIDKTKQKHVTPVVFDGEYPCFPASFDWIVSNLALHWFQDPKMALLRLIACLKPGGRLYISALGNNSFYEWRSSHAFKQVPCGILDFE